MKHNHSFIGQIIFVCIILAGHENIYAQEALSKDDKMRIELGLNMTKLISAVFNTNGEELIDPYTFVAQVSKERFGVRFGSFFVRKDEEDFNSGGFRTVKSSNIGGRIGLEFRKPVWRNLSVYYGADIIVEHKKEESSFFSQEQITSDQKALTYGGGPFLGLSLSVGKYMRLACESHFYYQQTQKNEILQEGSRPRIEKETKSNSLAHTLPTSLFFYVKF